MSREPFKTTLDSEVIKEIKHYAIDNNTDVSKIIEKLLIEFLKQQKSPK